MPSGCDCRCHSEMQLQICFECLDNHPHHPAMRDAEHTEIAHSSDSDNLHLNPKSLALF